MFPESRHTMRFSFLHLQHLMGYVRRLCLFIETESAFATVCTRLGTRGERRRQVGDDWFHTDSVSYIDPFYFGGWRACLVIR